jgi:predicted ATP-grasp superfamily ATP-dependent carboligase
MKIQNNSTPVLVLGCKIGALAIMRSLGSQQVPVYGVDEDPQSPALMSLYCRHKFIKEFDEDRPEEYLSHLLHIGKQIGSQTILIPTSDELSVFVAQNSQALSQLFLFPKIDTTLATELSSKEGMYKIAKKNRIPTPSTLFPRNLNDVMEFSEKMDFPVMLKGIHGNRLEVRTGLKMVAVRSKEELFEYYRHLEDPDSPSLMIQEYIPGGDDQVYIFNGYFSENSKCLAAFTGFKVRQFPIHVGAASLGECRWNEDVSKMTTAFMKRIGYRGILDIGYRLDPRDGRYKVLDINPRVGQAFRLFIAKNGMEVIRALYMDLTGQEVYPVVPREGRRWVIEDFDIISSFHYYQEGTLGVTEWLRSFRRLEEGAWFNWKDPLPFLIMCARLLKRALLWVLKKLQPAPKQNS